MRSAELLIQSILGDPGFDLFEEDRERERGAFQVYRVTLCTPRYRGFPDTWVFAICLAAEGAPRENRVREVSEEARSIIRRHRKESSLPLLLVSDDPAVRLAGGMLRLEEGDKVFVIDGRSVTNVDPQRQSLRFTPLVKAIRARLDKKELSRLMFRPYEPNDPAEGWRFFGRRKELDQLVNSSSNYWVIGARKVGKTSLLREAKRMLEERGEKVIDIPCQYYSRPAQLVGEIVRAIEPKLMDMVNRRHTRLGEPLLAAGLRSLLRRFQSVTLILDEVGQVISNNPQDDWVFMGTLREFSHRGNLRVFMSGYQEVYLKQSEFESPFVNFATTLELVGFTDAEIEECILDPLSVWGSINDKGKLVRLITSRVGRNPLLLQYLGAALFERVFEDTRSIDVLATHLIEQDPLPTFRPAVREIFDRNTPSPVERYLFCRRCWDAEQAQQRLDQVELSDPWVEETLARLGMETTYEDRRRCLERMDLKGLTEEVDFSRTRHRIAAPIIYTCLRRSEPMAEFLETLERDIRREASRAEPAPAGR